MVNVNRLREGLCLLAIIPRRTSKSWPNDGLQRAPPEVLWSSSPWTQVPPLQFHVGSLNVAFPDTSLHPPRFPPVSAPACSSLGQTLPPLHCCSPSPIPCPHLSSPPPSWELVAFSTLWTPPPGLHLLAGFPVLPLACAVCFPHSSLKFLFIINFH